MWSVVIKMCILPFARLTKPRNFFSISEDWQAGPRPREGGHRFCFPSRVTPKNHTELSPHRPPQPSERSAESGNGGAHSQVSALTDPDGDSVRGIETGKLESLPGAFTPRGTGALNAFQGELGSCGAPSEAESQESSGRTSERSAESGNGGAHSQVSQCNSVGIGNRMQQPTQRF